MVLSDKEPVKYYKQCQVDVCAGPRVDKSLFTEHHPVVQKHNSSLSLLIQHFLFSFQISYHEEREISAHCMAILKEIRFSYLTYCSQLYYILLNDAGRM